MCFIFMLTGWFGQAYSTAVWPLLGFFLMPYTTLVYMAAMLCNNHQLLGWWLALFVITAVLDVPLGLLKTAFLLVDR